MIKKLPFFSKLGEKELARLKDISVLKSYNAGEILFIQGEKPKFLHVLTKGTLKLYTTTPKGKEIYLHDLKPISLVAELVNFENITFPATAMFITSAEVLKIEYESFEREFLNDPKICFDMLKSVTSKLKMLNHILQGELTLDSEGKIARFIIEERELLNILKQNQIAKILNITPETLSRTLSKFKKLSLIKTGENGDIIMCDAQKLKEFYEI